MNYTVGMSLVDFIPVIFFGIGAIIFQRDLYNKMSKGAFALFAAGTINIICAGGCKALYKFLYAIQACDFKPLSNLFFPMQSIGFLFTGIGAIAMLCFRQESKKALSVVFTPVLFNGTFIFVSMMIAGLFCVDLGISIICKKMKKSWIIILVVVSFMCSLCMGYLSTKDFSVAIYNWIGEGVNIVGQGCFMLAAIFLHKYGLENYVIERK